MAGPLFAAALLAAGAASAAAQNLPLGAGLDWQKVAPDVRTFLCLPDQRPAWCGDALKAPPPSPASAPAEPPRTRGAPASAPAGPPAKSVADTDWQALLAALGQRPPNAADIATMERRAFEDRDASAFEVLGYAFATGWGRPMNYARAYEYYGLALVAGRESVRPNLDEIWRFLDDAQRQFLKFRFERAFGG